MRFRCISPKILLLRLSLSASSGPQPPTQVISVHVARFFNSSSSCGSVGSSLSSLQLAKHKESRKVPAFVFWDVDTCDLPAGANMLKVPHNITTAVRGCGIYGPIRMNAFGDVCAFSEFDKYAFPHIGIQFYHMFQEQRTSAYLSFFLRWVSRTQTPAHILIISSDTVFASALHGLRADRYNVLLASKTYAIDELSSAATIMWDWPSLAEGKNVAESTALSKMPLRRGSGCGPSTSSGQRVGENGIDKSKSLGFFGQILKWFKFWEKNATAAKLGCEPRGT